MPTKVFRRRPETQYVEPPPLEAEYHTPYWHGYGQGQVLRGAAMNNSDPTNEFLYQMPVPGAGEDNGVLHAQNGDTDTLVTNQSQPLDLKALNERLQVLGLNPQSTSTLNSHIHSTNRPLPPAPHPALGSAFKTNPISPHHHSSAEFTPQPHTLPHHIIQSQHPHPPPVPPQPARHARSQAQARSPAQHPPRYPDQLFSPTSERLSPRDHLSPPTAIEIGPSDSLSQMYRPYRGPAESVRSAQTRGTRRRGGTNVDGHTAEYDEDERASAWETRNAAESDAPSLEEMTMGRTDWAGETAGGDMLDMRERLLQHEAAEKSQQLAVLSQQLADTSSLASALAKLESTEEQLRTLQATLIAERVARTQIERSREEGEGDFREVKYELASAVRALRRAKEESKRNEEERRRLNRCFEETKQQLYKYHEELRVRDARAMGREEGRKEAWQEAERWMGGSPPIPVDPIPSVPQAVLRHTPLPSSQTLPQLQNPYASPMNSQPPTQPSPATQLANQQSYQTPPPPQAAASPQGHQGMPSFGQAMQTDHQAQGHALPHGQAGPQAMPQHTGQQPQHDIPMMPQHTGGPQLATPHLAPQHTDQPSQFGSGGPQLAPPIVGAPVPIGGGQPMIQPVIVPIPVPQAAASVPVPQVPMPQMPVQPPQPPHSQNFFRSAPHQHQPLPHAPPARAATVVHGHRTPQAGSYAHLPGRSGHERSATLSSVHPPQHQPPPSHHAAGSYLDRIDHDSRLKSILNGAPTHSAYESRHPTARSVSGMTDKPLPTPGMQQHHHAPQHPGMNRSRSTSHVTGRPPKRNSMLDQLHAHPHSHSNLNEGDRYPAFPRPGPPNGKGHSRQSSYTSVDPAAIALPHSVAGSALHSPASHRGTSIKTPQTKTSRRSKVAGALRGGTEIDDDLSAIIEDEHERRTSHEQPVGYGGLAQILPHQQAPQQPHHPQPPAAPGHQRQRAAYAPSMPPMRQRPVPKMPQPLGGGGRAHSEHHAGPHPLHAGRGGPDAMAQYISQRPDPPASGKPIGAHDLYVPPGMAPLAVHSSVRDIQGGRTSALGLEGLEDQAQHLHLGSAEAQSHSGHGRGRSGTIGSMKAPTITIQPPSSHNKSLVGSHVSGPTPTQPIAANTAKTHTLPTRRQTMVITEYYAPGPAGIETSHHPDAHMFPLPASRSQAPTVYSDFSPDSQAARVRSPHAESAGEKMPSVSIIDFALKHPLPDSRPTTVASVRVPKTTVMTEPDVDEPHARRKAPTKNGKRKPVPLNGHAVTSPRQIPLPQSRAGTYRPRTSTYAGTVGTIEEVTEEESGRENRYRRK